MTYGECVGGWLYMVRIISSVRPGGFLPGVEFMFHRSTKLGGLSFTSNRRCLLYARQ